VNGGLPGARGRKVLERANGAREVLASKVDHVRVEPGDLLHFDTWGGGGVGDPLARDIAKVAFDVEAGLVTREGARRYGVVMKSDSVVDERATAALRESMAQERGKRPLFDRGFESLDELKERCATETGLAAPVQPRFRQRAQDRSPTGAPAG
jgi:N-methylhydantoinase B